MGGLKMEHDSELTDEQIAEAEDNQCDALCNPTFWSDGQGGVICFGCGTSVWLVKPRQKRPLTVRSICPHVGDATAAGGGYLRM